MKFDVFQYSDIYIFTTYEWISSDFDDLHQLCEVGLDDPDKLGNPYFERLDKVPDYQDGKYLFSTSNLETAYLDFPEWFI